MDNKIRERERREKKKTRSGKREREEEKKGKKRRRRKQERKQNRRPVVVLLGVVEGVVVGGGPALREPLTDRTQHSLLPVLHPAPHHMQRHRHHLRCSKQTPAFMLLRWRCAEEYRCLPACVTLFVVGDDDDDDDDD
eukprot:2374121-Rhodomonas_salina.1